MTVNITFSLIEQLKGIAKQAGARIMEIRQAGVKAETKADSSPVTKADREAEEIVIRAIKKDIASAFPIISEEAFSQGKAPDIAGGREPFWLVDALDGTKEFVKGGSDFTVNIALIERARPALGVVFAPAAKAAYFGSREGSYIEEQNQPPRRIQCRQAPADGLVALVSRSHHTPEVDQFLASFKIKKETSAGSSLKFCEVARGQADIYPRMGRTMEWDTAAGHAVLLFAGGQVKNINGHDLLYGKPGFENPYFIAAGKDVEIFKDGRKDSSGGR